MVALRGRLHPTRRPFQDPERGDHLRLDRWEQSQLGLFRVVKQTRESLHVTEERIRPCRCFEIGSIISNLWRLRIVAPQTSLKSRDLGYSHMIESSSFFFFLRGRWSIGNRDYFRSCYSVSQHFLFFFFFWISPFTFRIYEKYRNIEKSEHRNLWSFANKKKKKKRANDTDNTKELNIWWTSLTFQPSWEQMVPSFREIDARRDQPNRYPLRGNRG